jgi:CRISPR-associated protein Cas1
MQIALFFSDHFGNPECVLKRPTTGDADLGLLQLQALQDIETAKRLAREFVEGKIRNQINLLKYYGRHRKHGTRYKSKIETAVPRMVDLVGTLESAGEEIVDYGKLRSRFMGIEANAARRYWDMVKILLSKQVKDFPGRKGRGARDLVNSLLNYGYGFLYRQVWREVVNAGLNPKISFLHAPQGEKPVLVFDLVEEFRPQAVDRVVFSMINRGGRLCIEKTSGRIEDRSRQKLVSSLLKRQGTAVPYRGEKVLLKNVIKRQVHRLCRHLRGEVDYRHFTAYY